MSNDTNNPRPTIGFGNVVGYVRRLQIRSDGSARMTEDFGFAAGRAPVVPADRVPADLFPTAAACAAATGATVLGKRAR